MHRRVRWVYVATALSLILCLAAVALWARSYWKADGIGRASGWEVATPTGNNVAWAQMQFISNRQGIIFAAYRGFEPAAGSAMYLRDAKTHWSWSHEIWIVNLKNELRVPGIGLFIGRDHDAVSNSGTLISQQFTTAIGSPHWLVAAIFGILPVVRLIRHIHRRKNAGVCLVCNYDLTGNVSGVCPECGTAIGRLFLFCGIIVA
jgi:hypothetical protein